MLYKLLALDMDGTLLNSEKQVSQGNLSAIKEAESLGVKVVISTGRPVEGVHKFMGILDLKAPIVTYHGAIIVNPTDMSVLYQKDLRKEDALSIMKCGKSLGTSQCIWSNGRLYALDDSYYVRQYAEHIGADCIIQKDMDVLANQGITKILWNDKPEQTVINLERVKELIKGEVAFTTSSPQYLEFIDKQVSKGNALAFLGQYFQIQASEMIAIGDEMNDESMLKLAGLGVAMENASDTVKSFADYVTLSNNDDGVAHVIEKFITGGADENLW